MSQADVFVRTMRLLQPFKRRALATSAGRSLFRALSGKQAFQCPLCGYAGPFADIYPDKGTRRHAQCPQCWSGERHRLHYLCFRELAQQHDFSSMTVLHVAPDPFFRTFFGQWFKAQHTADLNMAGVDFKVDLTALPFADASYDLVYASHVLEHIQDDRKAVREVHRVLRPGGLAILPVPIVSPHTIEYPEPNRFDDFHWRAPGPDYFERYAEHFSSIEIRSSEHFSDQHQLHLYEDRTHFPTQRLNLRKPMPGVRHVDLVPICRT
jgi:predicted SAM-dependent methyltransferase